jgi:hypothetical protein
MGPTIARTSWKRLRLLQVVLVALALAIAAPFHGQATCGTHCGTERWPVKTLTDADAGHVNFTSVGTTVAHLRGLAVPASRPADARVAPTEVTMFRISAILIGWKLEGDRDMHLVIADPAQPSITMIAEVPSTTCDHVCSSGHVAQFRAARAALIAKFGTPTSSFHRFTTPPPITVTGVGFFDFLHGQTGVAPNGVELHPVLKVTL